jgi:hypothetical protein
VAKQENKAKISIELDLDHPTGNFWIDNGLVYLVNQFGKGVFGSEEILNHLVGKLLQETGNKGEYYDEVTGEVKEYDKVNWVYPTNYFIKSVDSPPKVKIKIEGKEREFPTSPPRPTLKFELTKSQNYCHFCGEKSRVAKIKMWMFPFVVTQDKFSNFYSQGKGDIFLCPRCALAGLAGYLTWLWVAQGKTVHFFLFYSNLEELQVFHKEVIEASQISGGKGGNVKLSFYGPYLHETTLALLLKLFSYVEGREEEDQISQEGRELLASLLGAEEVTPVAPLTLYAVSGILGQAFDMKSFQEFSRLHLLYRLYKAWKEKLVKAPNPHQTVVNIFRQFQVREGNQYNTLWREKVCWAVLEFTDPFPHIESFLFEGRAKEKSPSPLVWGTEEVFQYYAKEVLSVDENLLKILRGFGYSLGTKAEEKKDMGLLYALRNAKNVEEFLKILNDIQFRLEITIPEKLLELGQGERIAGTPWLRVKTLLSIFAMNSYLRASSGNKKEGGEEYEQSAE